MLLSILLQETVTTTAPQMNPFAALGVGGLIFMLAFIVYLFATFWRINTKAGQPGWAAIIPIYNIIVYFKIIGRPLWWMLVYIGVYILYFTGVMSMMKNPAEGPGALMMVSLLVMFVIAIIDTHRLSKSFGKGAGFTVGMILLSPIFLGILAFGDSRYIGPNGKGESSMDVDPNILHA